MTLIIYAKCSDATILILDRKEMETANFGQSVKKYYIPKNNKFTLALAGESIMIDSIISKIRTDNNINSIVDKLYEISKDVPLVSGGPKICNGVLLINDENSLKFNDVWFSNGSNIIVENNPDFKCYGDDDGKILADYLIRKLNISELPYKDVCQYLISIFSEISKTINSVGKLEEHGLDLLILFDDGKIKKYKINGNLKTNKIKYEYDINKYFENELSKFIVDDIGPKSTSITTNIYENSPNNSLKISNTNQYLNLQSDREIYTYGSDITLSIINSKFMNGDTIQLIVSNKNENIVYENEITINDEIKNTYQEIIPIKGHKWSNLGRYVISVKYNDEVTKLDLYIVANFSSIQLDQKVYTWTDRVFFTIMMPELVDGSKVVKTIGNDPEYSVIITTSKGVLINYELHEIDASTGIFVGSVKLSGFVHESLDLNYNDNLGKTRGTGSDDGIIACSNNDKIEIKLKTSKELIQSEAIIRWNIGEIQWVTVPTLSKRGTIRIVDSDMNLDPDKIDKIMINVWSKSSRKTMLLHAMETGKNTGIFHADVSCTLDPYDASSLYVSERDELTAEYVDETLPDPYGINDSLNILSTCVFKKQHDSSTPKIIPIEKQFQFNMNNIEHGTVQIPPGSFMPGCEKHNNCYLPYVMKIGMNRTITWRNDDNAAHTVTSGTPNNGLDGKFDSGIISPKSSFAVKLFKKGEYPYFCLMHPWQQGIIIVD